MNKSAKNSVALFLAAALITGVFSISNPSIIDIEATGDKRSDYKQNDRYEEKDYGYEEEKKYSHDDEEKKYAHDDRDKKYEYPEEEKKYGNEMKYEYPQEEKKYAHDDRDKKYAYVEEEKKYGNEMKYGYKEDNKYGHDDKSSVKYIKCNNINVNGKDRNSHGGSDYPRGGGSDYPRGGGSEYPRGGGSEYSHDSYKTSNHKVPGFIKQTDKDVVVICIFNNDNDKKDRENKTAEKCEDCFTPRNFDQGEVPFGLLDDIRDGLFDEFNVTSFEELCEDLKAMIDMEMGMTTSEFEIILDAIVMGEANQPAFNRILDCLVLFDALIEDRTE